MTDWEIKKEFWQSTTVDTFDLEYIGSGYSEHRDLVKCYRNINPYDIGDWVRSEDFRKEIERLVGKQRSLKAERDTYRERALRAESRLDSISEALQCHLEDKEQNGTHES